MDVDQLYLDSSLPTSEKKTPTGITLHELEKRHILETLDVQHQNRTRTAALLGISVRTLRNKLHEYGCVSSEE
ncbi:MAG TPA: helix-turn-helix domain-containing protein [Chlamydiales bacterium]|nr:helix-turn-helix domain-containing protein [Chlamydiales bacterium]